MPLVHGELRQVAGSYLRKEQGHTLQPTAVVHQAYIRLAHQKNPNWEDCKLFFGVAARLMRQILMEGSARRAHYPVTRPGASSAFPRIKELNASTSYVLGVACHQREVVVLCGSSEQTIDDRKSVVFLRFRLRR